MRIYRPRNASYMKACYVLWLVNVEHVSQTEASIQVGLNSGTVNHIVRRQRFRHAYPIRPPHLRG